MRKILIDAHTHTVASGHAYSSLQEMAKAAADKGLEVLGITEHGPSVPGTCPTLYFKNMFVVPRQMYGIRLLMGCEINILDTKGGLDLTDEQIGWPTSPGAGMPLPTMVLGLFFLPITTSASSTTLSFKTTVSLSFLAYSS